MQEKHREREREIGSKMKHNQFEDHPYYLASPVMGSSKSETTLNQTPSSSSFSSNSEHASTSPTYTPNQEVSNMGNMKKTKSGRKANYAYRIRDHVKMGPRFSETVKGKLSLGAKIIQKGGRENIFRQIFGMSDEEKLLKASQCYLSTTAGPIAGILFISTHKVAFCSERSITIPSLTGTGESLKKTYKVMIPMKKIKRACESENVDRPTQKYIQIVTEDNFEFWFMGFVRYEKAFNNLQKAISLAR